MPDEEKLGESLQQAVLAALCFDVSNGAAIAAQVIPDHFDGVYRDFAARVLTYRRRYGRPPGPNYIGDLATQSSFGKDTLLRKRLVPNLIDEAESLNAEYAAVRVQDFIRRQTLKGAINNAIDRYSQDGEDMVGDVEHIFHEALQFRQHTFDAGLFFNEPRALNTAAKPEVYPIGIPELDKLRIGPTPKELLLYIAPKASGKTWFCVHVGRTAVMQRLKVAHISLEMDELKVMRRYQQSLFSVARGPGRFNRTYMEFDKLGRFETFKTRLRKPKLDFGNPKIREILSEKITAWGSRLGDLVVKSFPTGSLTIDHLISYLDYLESVKSFVPNVLIVDYPDLMKVDNRHDYRIGLGRNFEDLRGIAVRRNMALVAPTQGQRSTIGARHVRSANVAEDIRKVNTADTVLTFSRTSAEERLGLGRLRVEHARDSEGGAVLVLAQSYDTGQYVLDSIYIQQAYWERLKEVGRGEDEE